MAAIDGISLLIVAFSTLHGAWRGFTRLALGLCLWTVAFMAAMRFHTPMAEWTGHYVASPLGAQAVAVLVILIGVIVVGGMASAGLVRVVRATPLDGPDRLLGGAFGLARGAVVVVVLFTVASLLLQPIDLQALENNSRLTPYIQSGASGLRSYLPDFDLKGVARKLSTGHDASF